MSQENYWTRTRTGIATRRNVLCGAAVAGAGGAAWALAGCGDDDDGGAKKTAGPAQSPAAQQPRRGGTLNVSMGGEPGHLDPHSGGATSYSFGYVYGSVYSALLKPQSFGHKGALIPVGDLAEKWEQPDKTTVVFSLRQNAKWHNVAPVSGRAVTADDVVYSFQLQIQQKTTASALAGIKNITAPDKSTVKLELDGPNADFIGSQTAPNIKVVAKEAVDSKAGKLDEGPVVGTGPWVFKAWNKGIGFSVTRNPDYFIPGLPYADAMEGVVQKDQAQIEASFSTGKLSFVANAGGGIGLPNRAVKELDLKKYGVYRGAPRGTFWIMVNQDKPELKDPRIRKALLMAVDRDIIIANALDGFGSLDSICMEMPGPEWRLPEAELKKLLTQDLKAAKQLLDSAGGLSRQTMSHYEAAAAVAAAQLVQANFKAIGFETTLESVDNNGLTGGIFNPAAAKFFVVTTPISHAATFTGDLEIWFKTGGSRNGHHISDPELDKLIDQQKQEFDTAKRKELIFQIQRLIIDKAYVVPLTAGITATAYPLTSHNVEPPGATAAHRWYAEVWLDA